MPTTLSPLSLHPPSPTHAPGLASRLELIEAAAWADLFQSANAADVRALDLSVGLVGSTVMMAAAETDVLALNRAVGLGAHMPVAAPELDAVMAFFADAGSPRYFIQVSPTAEPTTLHDELLDRGFRHHNNWVKLVRFTRALPHVRTDLKVERLASDRADIFASALPTAFDWPEAMAGPFARTVGRSPWHHYAAYDGDEPVAVAAMFVVGDTAYLGPAVTQPDHRGRGAQSALIARRLHDAAALGATLAVTETAEERPERPVVQSYRNMRRLGFEVAYVRPNYLYERIA